jgi:hypothetical protein
MSVRVPNGHSEAAQDAPIARLDEGLWVAAAPLSFLGLHLGTRMTVVRLAGGELWVHSPIAATPELNASCRG